MKLLVLFLFTLLLTSATFALPPAYSEIQNGAFEKKLDAKMNALVNLEVPSEYSSLLGDGEYLVKINPGYDFSNLYLSTTNVEADDLIYSIIIKKSKVDQVIKNANVKGLDEYNLIIGVTKDAATNALASSIPLEQIKTDMRSGKIKYKAYGTTYIKIEFLRIMGPFLTAFSPDLAKVMPYLKGYT